MIRERQLNFTGHCIRMPTDEPINRFFLYESKVRPSIRPGAQSRTYRQQILSYLLPGEKALEATEIWKMAANKSSWNKHFVVSKKKSLQTYLLSSNDDDDDGDNVTYLTKETIPPFVEKLKGIKPILIPGHEFLLTIYQHTNINHGILIGSAIISQDNIYVLL